MPFPLPVCHSLWNLLQSGFIHSESFHITESKIELHMFVFLGLSAALVHVGHVLLEVWPTWLLTFPRSPLLVPLISLIVNARGPIRGI